MNSIRAKMPGTTVVQKPNQGFSRSLGVISCGGPFCLPAFGIQAGVPWRLPRLMRGPNKKVRKAECDRVLDRANQEKAVLSHDAQGMALDTNSTERSTQQAQADLISVNVQITAFTAALDALPDGEEKESMRSKIRRLNDRKENLEERIGKSGNSGLLLMQMQRSLAEKQVKELNTFIKDVEAS